MTPSETSNEHFPLDNAALEQWLSEVLEPQPNTVRQPLDAQAQAVVALVDRVRDVLVPIQPSPAFVHALGQSLLHAAGADRPTLRQRYRGWIWLGLAAAGSLVSLVGLTAYVLRHRQRPTSRHLQMTMRS
jgi:hypothetical protein